MSSFGRRKSDNQVYPKNKKSKLNKIGTTKTAGKTMHSSHCSYCERVTPHVNGKCNICGRKASKDEKKEFIENQRTSETPEIRRGRESMFGKIQKQWTRKELYSENGDHKVVIYTNKKYPNYTVELHPLDNGDEIDVLDRVSNSWIIFPAKNGKGIPNSPTGFDETGGYTREDAIKELELQVIEESDP